MQGDELKNISNTRTTSKAQEFQILPFQYEAWNDVLVVVAYIIRQCQTLQSRTSTTEVNELVQNRNFSETKS